MMHLDETGEVLDWKRMASDPELLVTEVLRHGEDHDVAIEATYGWYWAADALEAAAAVGERFPEAPDWVTTSTA
jgi:hypothetical protein